MKLKIMATGSNAIAIEEVYRSVSSLVGDVCTVEKCMIKDIKDIEKADLFVCGITQIDFLVQIVPRDKILLAEPRFASEFFIRVARIPVQSEVYVFHSNLVRINIMIQGLRNLGIKDVTFIPIAESMPREEIIEKLQEAKYIIGVNAFLQEMLASGKVYHRYLRHDVKIIGGDRVSSMETACRIIQWVAETFHKRMVNQVSDIKTKIHQSGKEESTVLDNIVSDVEKIANDSERAMGKLQTVVFKAFSNQISPYITLENAEKTEGMSGQITHSLANIKRLNDDLAGIVERIATNMEDVNR